MTTSNTTITPAAAALELLNELEIRSQNEHTAVASSTGPAELTGARVCQIDPPCDRPDATTFRFGDMYIRMVMPKDKQPLFCLADICKGCGMTSPNKVVKQIKEEYGCGEFNSSHPGEMGGVKLPPSQESDKQASEMGNVKGNPSSGASSEFKLTQMYLPDALGRLQMSTMVTEPQMYFVMMRGRSEASKRFRQWICEEVIPSIRRTGSYSIRVRMPEKNEDGKYDVAYTAFATDMCNKLGLHGEERSAFFWCIERAKQQGTAIGISIGEGKEKQRHAKEASYEAGLIEADNQKMLQLQQDVEFYKAEAVRFQKLDALKGGALSVLVQYPNDGVVRMLAKQILGFEEQN